LNLRRLRRQIYSLLPLATRAPPHTQEPHAEASTDNTQSRDPFQEPLFHHSSALTCSRQSLSRPVVSFDAGHGDTRFLEKENPGFRTLVEKGTVQSHLYI
jgi:hypothetical protein